MPEQVTITISETLYQRAHELARKRNQPVSDVLEEAITLVEAAQAPSASEEAAMAQEEAAYRTMHARLMAEHAGEYVAIYKGDLIDYDEDELALLRRLEEQYPDEVVLMKKVRPLPEPELRFRSPRFIRNNP